MSRPVHDEPSQASPVEGEVAVYGAGTTGMSMTPGAARETGRRLEAAAARADQGHGEHIDLDDAASLARWARRLDVSVEAVVLRSALARRGGLTGARHVFDVTARAS